MIKGEVINFKNVMNAAKLLMLPPNLKRRYVARVGRLVIAQTKKNVKDQKTVDGSPMKSRTREAPKEKRVYHKDGSVSTKKGRKKMFADMVKGKFLGIKLLGSDSARVQFFDNVGYVAYRHHHGASDWFKLKQNAKFPPIDYGKKCNEKQALELVEVGFMINGKRASKELIMRMVSVEQAAGVFKDRKKEWKIPTPARPVLGASDEQIDQFGSAIMNSLEDRFRAKQHANLLT